MLLLFNTTRNRSGPQARGPHLYGWIVATKEPFAVRCSLLTDSHCTPHSAFIPPGMPAFHTTVYAQPIQTPSTNAASSMDDPTCLIELDTTLKSSSN